MTTTEQLIDALSKDPVPAERPDALSRLALGWLAILLAYALFSICIAGLRSDIGAKVADPLYVIEIANLAALVVTALFSAVLLSFPDMRQQRLGVILPAVPALGLLAALAAGMAKAPLAPATPAGMECAICIVLYSAVPAAWAMLCLKRQATTHPYATGALVVLASTAIGALIVRVEEANDSLMHLLAWHYAPMLVCAAIGAWVGQKILRW
jgi:hypothetical protein